LPHIRTVQEEQFLSESSQAFDITRSSLTGAPARPPGYVVSTPDFKKRLPPRFTAPPLPRCADSGIPRHLELWQGEARRLRRRFRVEELKDLDFHGSGGNVAGLRALFAHKFSGGSVRGWRSVMAPDEIGVELVGFGGFCAGLKKLGYAGKVGSLWKAMSQRTGNKAGLEDLEPDLARQLDALARAFYKLFPGGYKEAWAAIDRLQTGRANFEEFALLLETFPAKGGLALKTAASIDARRVFEALDATGRGILVAEDLDFLYHWGRRRLGYALPEEEAIPVPVEAEAPSKAAKAEVLPSLVDLRDFLAQSFGSAARAWRIKFDVKGVGAVTTLTFKVGCRTSGWQRPTQRIWQELLEAGEGTASFRAFDPHTAEAIDILMEAARTRLDYEQLPSELAALWTKVLDPLSTGVVSRPEFIRDTVRLGLNRDQAGLVFQALDVAGTGWVAVSEVGFLETFDTVLMNAELVAEPSAGRPSILVPEKSTRGWQNRAFAVSRDLKHRWLATAAKERFEAVTDVRSRSLRQVASTETSLIHNMSEFYLEGARRLAAANAAAEAKDSEESSEESSESSARSKGSREQSKSARTAELS